MADLHDPKISAKNHTNSRVPKMARCMIRVLALIKNAMHLTKNRLMDDPKGWGGLRSILVAEYDGGIEYRLVNG
jgi:hypothetical protein